MNHTGQYLPLVTVAIPTYNQSRYIRQAIQSALNQDYQNLEILVLDDGSSDGTYEIALREFSDSRLKVVRNNPNLGRVANYRRGLQSATGEWFINLDGDDYFTNSAYISRAVEMIAKNPDIVLVFGRRYIDDNGNLSIDSRAGRKEKGDAVIDGNDILFGLVDRSVMLSHLTCLYKRDLALSLDFYRLNIISSDWESLCRLVLGHKVGFIEEIAGAWRKHGNNASKILNERDMIENYAFCASLHEYAKKTNLFETKIIDDWFDRFVASRLRGDIRTIAKKGSLGNYVRLIKGVRFINPQIVKLTVRSLNLHKNVCKDLCKRALSAIRSRARNRKK